MITSYGTKIEDRNTVHVWNISMDECLLDLPELLSDDEITRYSKIKHSLARSDFLRTRVSLRLILADYLSCPGADIVFSYSENGKPELSQDLSNSLKFNLSHSGRYGILAITPGTDVGVDIEQLRSGRDYVALARRFFTATEHQLIMKSADDQLFYKMWVLKEASVKARGMKLLQGLDRFACYIGEDEVLAIEDRQAEYRRDDWTVRQWQPDDNSIAAVVVRGKDSLIIEKEITNLLKC